MLLLNILIVRLSEMTKDHKTCCHILLCQFHAKKTWVDNLLPKVNVAERNQLYRLMCQLMHCITESTFNVICEEVMQEYSDNPDDWQYIEEDGHYGFAEYV